MNILTAVTYFLPSNLSKVLPEAFLLPVSIRDYLCFSCLSDSVLAQKELNFALSFFCPSVSGTIYAFHV